MDFRSCVLAMVVLLHCICISYISAAAVDDGLQSQIAPAMKMSYLDKVIRENIAQDLEDLMEMEHALRKNLNQIETKKRQLEIKKRQPLQCFLNIVSCWKRK